MYQQGDIVWVAYPYTDTDNQRHRPAVLVSGNDNNLNDNDRIFAKITTNRRSDQFSFSINNTNTLSPLPRVSEIRANKLVTLHKDAIQNKITSLSPDSLQELLILIQSVFAE